MNNLILELARALTKATETIGNIAAETNPEEVRMTVEIWNGEIKVQVFDGIEQLIKKYEIKNVKTSRFAETGLCYIVSFSIGGVLFQQYVNKAGLQYILNETGLKQ